MIIIPKVNLDNIQRHYRQFDLVDFNVRESGKRFLAARVRLRNNLFTRLRQMFLRNSTNSKDLVKKSVRVDKDISEALRNAIRDDKTFLTKTTNSSVLNEISTREIDLIDAQYFCDKITVYFTVEEYRLIQDTLDEIRSRGLKGVTFSSLVRSILYKWFGIAMESSIYAEFERFNKKTQPNKGKSSGMATNPISRSNSKQKKSNKKNMKGTYYGN